ncbi:hypothetical protein NRIC_29750 [Enterococcus florum]|uniref:YhcH/YjgK/YiaL family protein n=1 Tax=Enterococcus florum TaxID=2480627 RepID=A0A4P5PEL2_9ENTE|nr:YhcH/YjgK/YiaL family protein [Enterococcus florum]GCF95084.1 hypothetical protein NRIC_29750 [Enterococcus florum]
MIIDTFDRLEQYEKLLPKLPNALAAMAQIEEPLLGQRYLFDGGFLFFQEGETKPSQTAQFEAHRKYVDVQLVLSGNEYLAWSKLEDLTESTAYDQEKDVQKFSGAEQHVLKMTKGSAYICFPWDGHKAVFHIERPLNFRKAVIKLDFDGN